MKIQRAWGNARKKLNSNGVLTPANKKGGKIVAKDGTNRGGRRVKAGGKPASLADKIASGKSARVFEPFEFGVDDNFEPEDFVNMPELEGENIPKPSDYLSAEQKRRNAP